MAWVRFDFQVAGEVQYSRAFTALENDVKDLRSPLHDTADHLRHVVEMQFDSEGAHGLGERWEPLNPDYAAYKAMHVGPEPILVWSGRMRNAFVAGDAAIRELTSDRLVWGPAPGPESDKASWHQTGAGNLPARKIVALNSQDRREIDRVFAEWLNHKIRGRIGGAP